MGEVVFAKVIMFLGFGLAFFIGVGQDSNEFTTFGQSFAGLFFRFIEGISIDAAWSRRVFR